MRREYVSVSEAISMSGVRIAFTRGVPGPWGEAVRAIYDIKGIDYVPVEQQGASANEGLRKWTGQNSAPCVMIDNERPRSRWYEMLMLAETLAPEPRLIPADQAQRAQMFGILHEICGEDGFGWSGRLIQFDILQRQSTLALDGMLHKFGSSVSLQHAIDRMISIMRWLAEVLEAQQSAGSRYMVGDSLSAADIYWTTFSNKVAPIDQAICPMPGHYRQMCEIGAAAIGYDVPAILIDHRDYLLDTYFTLPLWF